MMNPKDGAQQLREDAVKICTPEFVQFIRTIDKIFPTNEELAKALANAFEPIAEILRIGYSHICFSAPKTPYYPEGVNQENRLSGSPENCDSAQEIKLTFKSGENGIFHFWAHPVKGVHWTEPEMDEIRFVGELMFVLIGRVRMEGLLRRVTTTDLMTSNLNMLGMMRHGSMLCEQQRLGEFVGMFLNLRNYKFINQTVGSQLGDEILVRYSAAVRSELSGDERMARPGGDNFVLLVRKGNAPKILKMLHELPITVSINGHARTFPISAHVGVYDIQSDDSIDHVLNCATVALNVVKRAGQSGDQIWYQPFMHEQLMHQKQISQIFSTALRNREFRVYYQPKVALEDKTLCGCEGLCRWMHDGEIIKPMEFIPVLEKEGTVCDLDLYVFEQVCADIRDWIDRGIEPVRVSVNFSQQHLQEDTFAEKLIAIMQKYSIESRYIEVELTEMSGAKNHDAMIEFLQKMREHGVCTSIDDFGTGYSSLNMLREFQMDIIKLDKSFLDRITPENADYKTDAIIIENIVRMAQSLDLEIISEGVETELQAEFLKSVHCNMAQGFLYDKPLPHDVFEERLLGSRVYE